jgi:hypothetical protein
VIFAARQPGDHDELAGLPGLTVTGLGDADARAMFVDDGHRASHELVEGPGSSTIQRQVRDGGAFAR